MQYHLLKADIWCSPKKSSNASLAHSRYAWQNKRHRRWHLFFLDHQRRTRLRQRVVLSGSSAWNNLTKTSDRKSCLTNITWILLYSVSLLLSFFLFSVHLWRVLPSQFYWFRFCGRSPRAWESMGDIAKAEIPFLIGYVAVFFLCVFSRGLCTMLI